MLSAALGTPNPDKTVGQDAALEEGSQFPFHEAGHVAIPVMLPFEESLKLCSHYTIKNAFLGVAGGQ
jgi:hypothetical protein